jgi:hypothetical protein
MGNFFLNLVCLYLTHSKRNGTKIIIICRDPVYSQSGHVERGSAAAFCMAMGVSICYGTHFYLGRYAASLSKVVTFRNL